MKKTGEYKLEEGKVVVKVNSMYFRPTEVDLLFGDASKDLPQLGWKPKNDLAALVREIIENDLTLFKKDSVHHLSEILQTASYYSNE